jgi:hypothetical protein
MELEVSVEEVTDEMLITYLKEAGRKQIKQDKKDIRVIFDEINIDKSITKASERINNLWTQWYKVKRKYQIQEEFESRKGKKAFREAMISKLWPSAVKDEVSQTLEGLDEDAELIRQDDKAFFKHVQEVAIANERSYLSQKKNKQNHSRNDPKSPERK